MVELTQELQIALNVAMDEARHRRHEFSGTEHLCLALLRFPAEHAQSSRRGRKIPDCGS